MGTNACTPQIASTAPRGILRSLLMTLPIAAWALVMFFHPGANTDSKSILAASVTTLFMTALFFMMMRTGTTYRWRRYFFVTLGVLFPIGFIYNMVLARGTMGIPMEEMIAGRTPFCFLAIPLLIVPAALTRTLVFPGSITASGHAIGVMVGLWLALTLVLGKGWCA